MEHCLHFRFFSFRVYFFLFLKCFHNKFQSNINSIKFSHWIFISFLTDLMFQFFSLHLFYHSIENDVCKKNITAINFVSFLFYQSSTKHECSSAMISCVWGRTNAHIYHHNHKNRSQSLNSTICHLIRIKMQIHLPPACVLFAE